MSFLASAVGFIVKLPGAVKVGLIALLITGSIQVRSEIRIHQLNKQIVQLQADVNTEKANELDLVTSINGQNAAIQEMQAKAQKLAEAAATRAVARLQLGKKESESLKSPTSTVKPGYTDMNAWLSKEFSR